MASNSRWVCEGGLQEDGGSGSQVGLRRERDVNRSRRSVRESRAECGLGEKDSQVRQLGTARLAMTVVLKQRDS